ncbi:nuclear transport factor 2 family protein [Streptomyces sp. NPDC048172]|uniref:nuclear transport factor 2 family protein n=1 Tax=Streptomyces sp. NPDC048172 TaxID=3365505 RepID=UPI003712B13A
MTTTQQLADRAAIADLVARLGHWLDSGDPGTEALRDIYAEDVVVETVRGTLCGLDDVMTHVGRARTGDERTQHFNTDLLIDLDGDRAEVAVQQLVHFFRPGGTPHRTAGVRCAYGAVRTGEGWRFARAEFAPRWIEHAEAEAQAQSVTAPSSASAS